MNDWKTVAKPHQGVLHHGLFHYIKAFQHTSLISFSIQIKCNKKGRSYALLSLPSNGQMECHLTIDATYEPKTNKKTPCHLTRITLLNDGSRLIQHAYIVLADETGGALSTFHIQHIDAKKQALFNDESISVVLNDADKASIQGDVERLVRAKLHELYKYRNQYISQRSRILNDIDIELAGLPSFYDNIQLTTEQIQHLLGLFIQQKAIYEELYLYEDHPLRSEMFPASETINSMIQSLNDGLTRLSAVKKAMKLEKSPALGKHKSEIHSDLKTKSKVTKLKPLIDSDALEKAQHILSQLKDCPEELLCHLQGEILILSQHPPKQIQGLIRKCENMIEQKRQNFEAQRQQKIRMVQVALDDYEKTLDELQRIQTMHKTLLNQLVDSSPSVEEAYLKTIIPFASIIRQAQKQFIALRVDSTALEPTLLRKKAAFLSHPFSRRIFAFINEYLLSWVQYALLSRATETMKYLLIMYPSTRAILNNLEPYYADLIREMMSFISRPREALAPHELKNLKDLVDTSYFCFENSSQYQAVFFKIGAENKKHLIEDSGLLNQQTMFHHSKLIQADYISSILVLSALNGHTDIFKLFITQGFAIDRELYKDASRIFLKTLARFPSIQAKFKELLALQMPELINYRSSPHSQRLWICLAYLLISTLVIYFLYALINQLPRLENDDIRPSPGM